jgi:hypothetical protein
MAAELSGHLGYEHGQAPPGGAGHARNAFYGEDGPHPGIGRCGSSSRATVPVRSSHRSSQSTDGASTASTTRSSPCTGAGCRCATSSASGRAVPGRGRPRSDQPGHRRRPRRRPRWQVRPLEDVYPILFPDALIVNVRVLRRVGVNLEANASARPLVPADAEGAEFWPWVQTASSS